ncbi:MAG: lysine--tRNA ligase [Deltaproteobacteria bacterium]|nr:lysine--tRNA ligase [Deltaproteobacteria bacterium]
MDQKLVSDQQSTVIAQRQEKALALKEQGVRLHPNHFRPTFAIGELRRRFSDVAAEELELVETKFILAGRIMARRDYGKSTFFDLQDHSGRVQVYIRKNDISESQFSLCKKIDIGDIVGVTGRIFKTKTGELTLLVSDLELVTKSMLPLPEKYHDLNIETRYRQRYLDLIMNNEAREVFRLRTKVVSLVRKYLENLEYLEVETPMMQAIPGGATAKPFETYHHALDMKLYLRIAPELYLKRLLVGGFNRVFELNRNFRNEGISTQHNPEFTMLEFYQCYATFHDLMDLTEDMFSWIAREIKGTETFIYQGQEVRLARPWRRIGFHQSLVEIGGISPEALTDLDKALEIVNDLGAPMPKREVLGKVLAKIFDLLVEPKLTDPTFITHYPADISPLARRSDNDQTLTDRFELFIVGREMANGFSELNDPLDQRERFLAQVAEREAGDEEAQFMDEDYVRALMYGMPPAAGEGVGIDRLVMLLADAASIKDVILFPHQRPEKLGV